MNRPTKVAKSPLPFAPQRQENGSAHMNQIRVLIVDDHTTVLAGLTAIIGMQPDMVVVAEAANGFEALGLWQQHRPDITLLDLRMPKMDGVSALNEIRQRDQSARVIVLTTYDADLDILRAVKAGAKGYLLKDARREELLDCIRKVNSGETRIPQAIMQKLVMGISSEPMTDREAEVLQLLAVGRSNKEIGANLSISEFTVKGHLRSIFSKLNVLSRTEAIAAASRRGLVQF
jgi:two-component system NarL family response regulator